jgi:hypothetical protein
MTLLLFYCLKIQECFKLYDEYISNLKSDTRKLAELKQNNLPAFCYTRDEINFNKRILRNQFVEVWVYTAFQIDSGSVRADEKKNPGQPSALRINILISNFSSCLMYQII